MPRLDLRCACGHRYEAIRSFSVNDPGADRCPACGGTDLETLPTPFLSRDVRRSTEGMDADERALHLDNKAWMEANSEKLLSGEWGHVVPKECPVEFRPVCPEGLRRRYY